MRRVALVIMLALLCWALPGWSRAGGGQAFSGGGARSGGGGFTTSNNNTHSYNTQPVYNHPGGGSGGGGGIGVLIFCIVAFAIVAMIVLNAKSQTRGLDQTDFNSTNFDRGPPLAPTNLQAGLEKIKATDPNFSQQVFIDRVQTAFYAIQTAWQKCDLDGGARNYMSDAIVRRFQMQIDDMKAKRRHNVLDNLVIGGVHLIDANQEGGFDSIQVKITASCADYTVEDVSGQMVEGSKEIQPWIEYWTLARTTGVKTPAPGTSAAKANTCPSCGAPLNIGETGKCAFCGNEVKTMNFEWVLNTITQASEV